MIWLLVALSIQSHAIVDGEKVIVPSRLERLMMLRTSVRLTFLDDDGQVKQFCSALPSEGRHLTSAGHCFLSPQIRKLVDEGRVFAESWSPTAAFRRVRKPIREVKFQVAKDGDIATLELDEDHEIPLPPKVEVGCDPESPFVVAGFGDDENGFRPKILRLAHYREEKDPAVRSKIFNVLSANIPGVGRATSADWEIVSAVKGKACYGDSGGPTFCRERGRWKLFGVSSAIVSDKRAVSPAFTVGFCREVPMMGIIRAASAEETAAKLRAASPVKPVESEDQPARTQP